jgi:hypothetical protein
MIRDGLQQAKADCALMNACMANSRFINALDALRHDPTPAKIKTAREALDEITAHFNTLAHIVGQHYCGTVVPLRQESSGAPS